MTFPWPNPDSQRDRERTDRIRELAAELAGVKVTLAVRTGERDAALADAAAQRVRVAELAAENVQLVDRARVAQAAATTARDEERLAKRNARRGEEEIAVLRAELAESERLRQSRRLA